MRENCCVCALVLSGATVALVEAGTQLGTAFTYQGQLKQAGVPADGTYDFRFDLLSEGFRIDRVCVFQVAVVNGLFTADVDFGAVHFDGAALDLQVAVKRHFPGEIEDCSPNTFDPYTPLGAPQPITPTPYALHALSSGNGHALNASDGDPANAVFVNEFANVGIGTTAPSTRLHVTDGDVVPGAIHPNSIAAFQRDGSAILYVESSESGVAGVSFGHPGKAMAGELVFGDPGTPEGVQLRTGGAARLAISSIGRVGIGISNPTAKLHVSGTPGTDGVGFPDGTLQTTAYRRLKTSAVFDPPAVAAGASTTVSIPVVGAAVGDVAIFNPRVGLPAGLVVAQTRVNTNEVAVTLYNASSLALDAPSNTADVVIFK